ATACKQISATTARPAVKLSPGGNASAKPSRPLVFLFTLSDASAMSAPVRADTNFTTLVSKLTLNPNAFSPPCASNMICTQLVWPCSMAPLDTESIRDTDAGTYTLGGPEPEGEKPLGGGQALIGTSGSMPAAYRPACTQSEILMMDEDAPLPQ